MFACVHVFASCSQDEISTEQNQPQRKRLGKMSLFTLHVESNGSEPTAANARPLEENQSIETPAILDMKW